MQKTGAGILVASSLLALNGCGTLLSGPSLISMATSLIGGVANGAIFGGSVVGAIKSATDGGPSDKEADAGAGGDPEDPSSRNSIADSR